jgi:hypothetical protein
LCDQVGHIWRGKRVRKAAAEDRVSTANGLENLGETRYRIRDIVVVVSSSGFMGFNKQFPGFLCELVLWVMVRRPAFVGRGRGRAATSSARSTVVVVVGRGVKAEKREINGFIF